MATVNLSAQLGGNWPEEVPPSSCPSPQAAPSWVIQLLQRILGKELHPSVGMGHWTGSITTELQPDPSCSILHAGDQDRGVMGTANGAG